MSNWDLFATWIGANANNGTWYVGGVIAACGFVTSSTLLVIVGLLSYVFLALVSISGYETGLNTMSLMRGSFGVKGSIVPSLINIVQFVGWAAVNTYIAAVSVSLVLREVFGWSAKNQTMDRIGLFAGIIIMSILHLISISLGEKSVKWIERIGIVLVTIFVLWESVIVLKMVPLHQIMTWQPPKHLHLPAGMAVDTLAAFNLAWVTAAADFSRFAKKKSGATIWSFIGANLGLIWFALMGIIATIATAITLQKFDPNNSDPSTIAAKLGLGALALIVIMLTSTTANAVNLMAAGSAATNIFKKLKLKPALWIVTLIATLVTFIPAYVATFLETFELFLDGVGMFLGPEIAIFLIDYFVLKKRNYQIDAFDQPQGPYWYVHGFNLVAITSWALGVVLYFLLRQLPVINQTLGATFPAMLVTAVLYWQWMLSFHKKQ
ncbi:cytosine permease [Bombilactobacillus folatiphilus]|uniref:Cytosine permease n=1 Tax=Bombilactobacillus folatiphilus TaxID=2923362 RepID=A0ABY4PBE8_9LACO|nr:cytosine permease [Bombilactobacillus folatiphilus]UQS82920.1 cytosine permease [Bombilactobacillus folatiphilus]